MKILLATVAVSGLLASHVFGQGAQADQIERRAKELVNQNNVRQGIRSPAPPPVRRAPGVANPGAAIPASTPEQSIAKLRTDLAALKPGSPATPEQKRQLIKDIAVACRGPKPSLPAVSTFVNALTGASVDRTLEPAQVSRLAQDIDAVANSAGMPSSRLDAIIADVQAILQVEGANRNHAVSAANHLKTVGLEVQRSTVR
jgi:hypothetical protein